MYKSIKLEQNGDEDDMGVPNENSINYINKFLTNTSKLLSDKGYVKEKDRLKFTWIRAKQSKLSVKLPYVRWRSSNRLYNEWKWLKETNREYVCENNSKQTEKLHFLKKNCQFKSDAWRDQNQETPIKELMSSYLNPANSNMLWVMKNASNEKFRKLSNLFNELNIGSIEENSDSVSE